MVTTALTPKNAKKNGYAFGIGNSALRVWVAMRLAKDIGTCCSLLRGEPVDPSCLDSDELVWMETMRLVRLDTAAIDLVDEGLRRATVLRVLRETA